MATKPFAYLAAITATVLTRVSTCPVAMVTVPSVELQAFCMDAVLLITVWW